MQNFSKSIDQGTTTECRDNREPAQRVDLRTGFLPSFFEKSVDQGTTTECRDTKKPV